MLPRVRDTPAPTTGIFRGLTSAGHPGEPCDCCLLSSRYSKSPEHQDANKPTAHGVLSAGSWLVQGCSGMGTPAHPSTVLPLSWQHHVPLFYFIFIF